MIIKNLVDREDQVSHKIYLQFKNSDKEGISLTLESRDSEELLLVLKGYFRLLCSKELEMDRDDIRDEIVIPYCSSHQVIYFILARFERFDDNLIRYFQVTCQGWNYSHNSEPGCLHIINFDFQPPYQQPPPGNPKIH